MTHTEQHVTFDACEGELAVRDELAALRAGIVEALAYKAASRQPFYCDLYNSHSDSGRCFGTACAVAETASGQRFACDHHASITEREGGRVIRLVAS